MFENRQIALIKTRCRRFRNSFECLKIHGAMKNEPILTQKVPKEAQTSIKLFFKNMLLYMNGLSKFRVFYAQDGLLDPGLFWLNL